LPAVSAETPETVASSLTAALRDGDAERALALWDADAAIIGPDGAAVRGRDAIEQVLRSLIEHAADVDARVERVFQAGGVAVAVGTLTLNGSHDSFSHQGRSLVVYRRGEDGRWRIALDAPWGLPST
jgi:uncharacterized protein (TIGR02246 family)